MKKYSLCTIVFLSLASVSFSQPSSGPNCVHIPSSPGGGGLLTSYSYNGECHTPKGNLHVLVVFVGFTDPDQPESDHWDYNTIPDWANGSDNDIFNKEVANIGSPSNLSLFYKQMSLGDFTITATVYPEQAMIEYDPSMASMNSDVCEWLSNDDASYNWGQFDNRTNNANWVTDNNVDDPDGKIDYVVFVYRNLVSYTYSGISGIQGSNLELETDYGGGSKTFEITNGHVAELSSDSPQAFWGFFQHEFAHNFYDCPHFGNTNGTVGNHFYTGRTWGMMSGDMRVYNCANAWEKWYLGWIDISASGVSGDIDEIDDLSGTAGIYILRDFNYYGDAIRLKIPNSTNQFLWLENHSGLTEYDDRESWQTGADNFDIPSAPLGLMMFVENIAANYTSVNRFSQGCNGIRALSSEGNFDYTHSATKSSTTGWWGLHYDFYPSLANPYGAHSNQMAIRDDYPTEDGTICLHTGSNGNEFSFCNEMNDVVKLNGTTEFGQFMIDASFQEGDKVG